MPKKSKGKKRGSQEAGTHAHAKEPSLLDVEKGDPSRQPSPHHLHTLGPGNEGSASEDKAAADQNQKTTQEHETAPQMPQKTASPNSISLKKAPSPTPTPAQNAHMKQALLAGHRRKSSDDRGRKSVVAESLRKQRQEKAAATWDKLVREAEARAEQEGEPSEIERKKPASFNIGDYTKDIATSKKEKEVLDILTALRNSPFFNGLPKKTQKTILAEEGRKPGRIEALDTIAMKERKHSIDEDEEYFADRQLREKHNEEYRLKYLKGKREPWVTWLILFLFHSIIFVNLVICMEESYRLIIEHSKFDRLLLNDIFNCLERVDTGTFTNHFFNIIHALTCVGVLATGKLETANLCWAYVFAALAHACNEAFQFFIDLRYPSADKHITLAKAARSFFWLIGFQLSSTLIVIHRYYDMTHILQKRTLHLSTNIFGGRLLNDHIIYKNESSFLQKKYVLRQANAIKINGIVQKIQFYRQQGGEPDADELRKEIQRASKELLELDISKSGPGTLREMRKKNADQMQKLKGVSSTEAIGVDAPGKQTVILGGNQKSDKNVEADKNKGKKQNPSSTTPKVNKDKISIETENKKPPVPPAVAKDKQA